MRYSSLALLILSAIFLVAALGIVFEAVVYAVKDPPLTVAALLATVAGLFLTAQRQIADRQETTSRFYLEQYQLGFDRAYEILESAKAGDALMRMKWIAAARILATARSLFDRITVRAHREVAQMSIPHESQRFQQFFQLPAWAYYGVPPPANMSAEETLTEAAKRSTAGEGSTVSTLQSIPEKVIHSIWQAVAYPKNYRDVLGERFDEGQRLFLPEGLRAYLNHKDQWHSAAGVLHQRAPGEPRE